MTRVLPSAASPSILRNRRGVINSGTTAVSDILTTAAPIVACDLFTSVTVGFRMLYVFVVLEVGTRRILHWNVTEHPTAAWTIQQFRAIITPETATRFVVTH